MPGTQQVTLPHQLSLILCDSGHTGQGGLCLFSGGCCRPWNQSRTSSGNPWRGKSLPDWLGPEARLSPELGAQLCDPAPYVNLSQSLHPVGLRLLGYTMGVWRACSLGTIQLRECGAGEALGRPAQ